MRAASAFPEDSPYLTVAEAARFCRFDTCAEPREAFRKWARRQGLPMVRRGRMLLVDRRLLEAILHPGSGRVRHAGKCVTFPRTTKPQQF
jgi:hypothetical protein